MYDPKWSCPTCEPNTASCQANSDYGTWTENQFYGNNYADGWINWSQVTQFSNQYPAGHQTQVVNSSDDGKFYAWAYLDYLTWNTQPLFKAWIDQYYTVARLIFDFDELTDPLKPGGLIQGLTFKKIPNMQLDQAMDWKSFVWSEWKLDDPNVYVIWDVTNWTQILIWDKSGNPINLSSPQYYGMFQPGTTILIKANNPTPTDVNAADCCSTDDTRTVLAVDTATFNWKTYTRLTLEWGVGTQYPWVYVKGYNSAPNNVVPALNGKNGEVYPWDTVMYVWTGRNDCDFITSQAPRQGYNMRNSYIQHFWKKLSFNKAELNKRYALPNWTQDYINSRIRETNIALLKEVSMAFFLGRNRSPDNNIALPWTNSGRAPSETMWVLPALRRLAALRPDLNVIDSAAWLMSDQDRVRLILKKIMQVQNSWFLPRWGTVTMLMDWTAAAAFMKLNKAWNEFTWPFYTQTNSVEKNFTLPVIRTPYGSTEIARDHMFERITQNKWVILFLPTQLIAVRQRREQAFDVTSSGIIKATQWFNMKNVTMPNQLECNDYNIRTELSFILWGMDAWAAVWTAAYGMIEWFAI